MPILNFNDQRILFIHIPKTAGASLESHLRQVAKVGLFCGDFKKMRELKLPCSPQHFHLAILNSFFPRKFFDWRFTVVRDPMDRLKSEYRMRRGIFADESLTFPAWVGAVFQRYGKNPYVFDNHIRPQVEFVDDHVEVFRFEDGLDRVLDRVAERLGAPEIASGDFHKQQHPRIEIDCPPACAEAVGEFYRADYERLGYAPPVASGAPVE